MTLLPYVFIWHHKWPDYKERMLWINSPWNVQLAKEQAEKMSLVPKE